MPSPASARNVPRPGGTWNGPFVPGFSAATGPAEPRGTLFRAPVTPRRVRSPEERVMIESLEYALVAAWSGLAFISLCGFAWESIQSLRLRSSEPASQEEAIPCRDPAVRTGSAAMNRTMPTAMPYPPQPRGARPLRSRRRAVQPVSRSIPSRTIDAALADDPSFVMGHCFKAGLLVTTTRARRGARDRGGARGGGEPRRQGAAARAYVHQCRARLAGARFCGGGQALRRHRC